jgi:endonuclease/exonuclease/phosphatase family metal-dependent hydrolase
MTTRKYRILVLLSAAGALATAGLFAQTSPWPFPSRAPSGSSAGAGSRTITVAFWNIQWFPGRRTNPSKSEEDRQIASVHADMKQMNVDILGMEEVRDFAHAGVAVQPLAGFKVDVCANFPPREGQTETQQVAIASRLQPLSAWAEEWKPAGALSPPRGFAFAAYQVAPRQLALVYALHLKSNRGDAKEDIAMRQESIKQLQSHMEAMQKAYESLGTITWVIGGDFNTSPDDPRWASETTTHSLMDGGFGWSWQNMPASAHVTVPPDKSFPAACFDHIFYRGATLRRATVLNTSAQSSDHRAVQVTLELPAP